MPEEPKQPSREKPAYEAPALIELGALARGVGGSNCSRGTNPGGLPCLTGNGPTALCSAGLGFGG